MNDIVFRQFFGPSANHSRACVEVSFPLQGKTCNLAAFEPALAKMDVRLGSTLPKGSLPLDEALAALVRAALTLVAAPWINRRRSEDRAIVAVSCCRPGLARAVLSASLHMLRAGEERAVAESAEHWLNFRRGLAEIDPHGAWMLAAAAMFGREGVPVNRRGAMYQLGMCAKGIHFFELGNQFDSLSGMVFARDKLTTIELLRRTGLPTTSGVLIRSREHALQTAKRIGTPCVVKPVSMGKGAGVSTGLTTDEQIIAAVEGALAHSKSHQVMIENHVAGFDHRMVVIGGEFLWTYRRLPARVQGDGKHTVGDLIARENARRAAIRGGPEDYLCAIDPGDQLQRFIGERYGLSLDSVLEKGREIELAGQANVAQGGVLEDVTASVHPDNRSLALKVARLFRMRALGIDFMSPDISRSWKDGDSAIIEVNGTPGIGGLADAILVQRIVLPNRRSGRVPSIVAIGDEAFRAKVGTALRTAMKAQGLRLSIADYPGACSPQDMTGASESASMVECLLLDADAQAAAVLCDPRQVAHTGLPLRRCDLVLKQEAGSFPWISAGAVLEGEISSATLTEAVQQLARLYREPEEGGPLPVLVPVPASETEGDQPAAFGLTVWRTRAMPRAWFWRQVGVERDDVSGLTTKADLLGAVEALAHMILTRDGGEGLAGTFAHAPLPPTWLLTTFEAKIPLPGGREREARAALLAAVGRVNQITTLQVD